jgi:DNA-binding phage protein
MSASLRIRDGLLDRLKKNAGIADDVAFARLLGVSRDTLYRLREGAAPSVGTIASIAQAFSLGVGEVATIVPNDHAESESSAA